jgi:NAD(P)-dependent dehydrogenase (short-subunit alcohol dehydrogenase family)
MLKNKRIVIIGGTTGLGLSAAKAFIANGADVVVVGRSAESVAEAKNILGNHAVAISGDATNADTC